MLMLYARKSMKKVFKNILKPMIINRIPVIENAIISRLLVFSLFLLLAIECVKVSMPAHQALLFTF